MSVPLDREGIFAAGRQALLDALQSLEQRAHDKAERMLRDGERTARQLTLDSEQRAYQLTTAEGRARQTLADAEQRAKQVTLETASRLAELEQQLAEVHDQLEAARAQIEEQVVTVRGQVEVARASLNTIRQQLTSGAPARQAEAPPRPTRCRVHRCRGLRSSHQPPLGDWPASGSKKRGWTQPERPARRRRYAETTAAGRARGQRVERQRGAGGSGARVRRGGLNRAPPVCSGADPARVREHGRAICRRRLTTSRSHARHNRHAGGTTAEQISITRPSQSSRGAPRPLAAHVTSRSQASRGAIGGKSHVDHKRHAIAAGRLAGGRADPKRYTSERYTNQERKIERRMALAEADRAAVIQKHRLHASDTGSADVQVALLTHRISALAEHLRANKHDNHSQRGLRKMVGHRRRLLNYLSRTEHERYLKLIADLGLRR